MKIKINKQGYVEGPIINDATEEIEITEEQFEQISKIKFDCAWRYVDGEFKEEIVNEANYYRRLREQECFKYIDRSQLWYSALTAEQHNELVEWYVKWLNVTDTKIIPEKPSWLK